MIDSVIDMRENSQDNLSRLVNERSNSPRGRTSSQQSGGSSGSVVAISRSSWHRTQPPAESNASRENVATSATAAAAGDGRTVSLQEHETTVKALGEENVHLTHVRGRNRLFLALWLC